MGCLLALVVAVNSQAISAGIETDKFGRVLRTRTETRTDQNAPEASVRQQTTQRTRTEETPTRKPARVRAQPVTRGQSPIEATTTASTTMPSSTILTTRGTLSSTFKLFSSFYSSNRISY